MEESLRRRPNRTADDPSDAVSLCADGQAELRRAGTLFWPETRTLVVADLHLGKSERLARRGGPLLPPYEVDETLDRLEAEIVATTPNRVLCLGDSFDDARAAHRLSERHANRLRALTDGCDWIWISGNHDPAAPCALGGRGAAELRDGPFAFRHIPTVAPSADAFEIAGHLHPKATLQAQGRRLSRRCFLGDARRMILPAFGAYTGGLDAADPAFDPLFEANATAWLLGRTLHALPRSALSAPNALPTTPG